MCGTDGITCDVGQQDGEEDHRSKQGGDHDVQRIPTARGHLRVEAHDKANWGDWLLLENMHKNATE